MWKWPYHPKIKLDLNALPNCQPVPLRDCFPHEKQVIYQLFDLWRSDLIIAPPHLQEISVQ